MAHIVASSLCKGRDAQEITLISSEWPIAGHKPCFSFHGVTARADSLVIREHTNRGNTMIRPSSSHTRGHTIAFRDSIEWEELPSLVSSLPQRLRHVGGEGTPRAERRLADAALSEAEQFNTAWNVTMPADLCELDAPQPFRETLQGLATREVNEPEVFRHFFG
jgi:hypothetical protein